MKEFWSGRRVLVTGAAGFLGGWTVGSLVNSGADVVGLDIVSTDVRNSRAGYSAVAGDVRVSETVTGLLKEFDIEFVLHLAARALVGPALERPVETLEHNVAGTWTVLEACRLVSSVRSVVVASSDKAYGDHGGDPYDEQVPLRPSHPYDASKACGDLIASAYAASYALPVAITRCANLYGGGDLNWSRIVPGTIRSVLEGKNPVIRSDGTCIRDYMYVQDAVDGLLALARGVEERPELRGDAFNFAGGEPCSVLDIAERIVGLMGSDLQPEVRNEAVGEIPNQRVLADKASKLLGWKPAHSMNEGLVNTIGWYSSRSYS